MNWKVITGGVGIKRGLEGRKHEYFHACFYKLHYSFIQLNDLSQ